MVESGDIVICFDPATNGVQVKMNHEKIKNVEFAVAIMQIAIDAFKRQIDFAAAMQHQQAIQQSMEAQRLANGLLLSR